MVFCLLASCKHKGRRNKAVVVVFCLLVCVCGNYSERVSSARALPSTTSDSHKSQFIFGVLQKTEEHDEVASSFLEFSKKNGRTMSRTEGNRSVLELSKPICLAVPKSLQVY